jgi:hypothetical protein
MAQASEKKMARKISLVYATLDLSLSLILCNEKMYLERKQLKGNESN